MTIEFSQEKNKIRIVVQAVLNFETEHGNKISSKSAEQVGLPPEGVFAMSENGELLGGLTYRVYNDWVWLEQGFVWKPHRRKGIYTRLIRELEIVAKKAGLMGMDVWTYEWEAPEVYEALGFRHNGVHHNFPRGNTALSYVKEFEEN